MLKRELERNRLGHFLLTDNLRVRSRLRWLGFRWTNVSQISEFCTNDVASKWATDKGTIDSFESRHRHSNRAFWSLSIVWRLEHLVVVSKFQQDSKVPTYFSFVGTKMYGYCVYRYLKKHCFQYSILHSIKPNYVIGTS